MPDNHQKNIATFVHLSSFSRFIIPLGNFIGPVILWILHKDKSPFIDQHGKQIINFQMSILLYTLVLGAISLPFFAFTFFNGFDVFNSFHFPDFHFNFKKPSPFFYLTGGFVFFVVIAFVIEVVLIVKASLAARDGNFYNYPFTINFFK